MTLTGKSLVAVFTSFRDRREGRWRRWLDGDFILLVLLLLLTYLPTLSRHIVPVHDTLYAFQIYYHNYNEFVATGDLARWLPYGMYGVPAAFDQVICLSPMCYLVGLLGAALGVRDVLFLFKMTLLGEQFLFLLGLYLLAKIIFSTRLTRVLVCVAAILTTTCFAQIWWDWRHYYLLPLMLHFVLLFFTQQKPLYFWATGVTAAFSLTGSLIYFSPVLLFVLVIVAASLMLHDRRALWTLLRPSWSNMFGGLVFALCALAYGWQVFHCLDHVSVMVNGRDAVSGRVPIETFLTYGGQADRQVLTSFLTGWPPYGDNTYYIGLFPLFGVVWGAFHIRSRLFWSFLTAALALILLSLGGMAARLIYHFPMMSLFRHIGLVYGPIKLLLLLAGGFALDRAVQWIYAVRASVPRGRFSFLPGALLAALIPLDGWLIQAVREARLHWRQSALTLTDLNCLFVCGRFGLYVAVAAALYLVARRKLLPRGLWPLVASSSLAVVIMADTGSYRYLIHATMPRLSSQEVADFQSFRARPLPFCELRQELSADFQAEPALRRYSALPPRPAHSTYTMAYNFFAIDPAFPRFRTDMFSRRVDQLIRARGGNPKQYPDNEFLPANDRWLRGALGCVGPKIRIVTEPLCANGSVQQVLEGIHGLPPDSDTVILRTAPPPPSEVSDSESSAPPRVDVLHFSGNTLVCRTYVPPGKPAWLYYADTWHPSWRCLVNGAAVPVVEANHAFKAVRLPAGEATVRFTFNGRGCVLPCYALAVLGLCFALGSIAYGMARLRAPTPPRRPRINNQFSSLLSKGDSMNPLPQRRDIPCVLCGAGTPYRVRYPERLQAAAIDFAARKTPIRQHFQIVECCGCGLIYSTPILPAETIHRLYQHSPFLQEGQLGNMLHDYREQLRQVLPLLPARGRLLEIGCANGFFLEAALELGFEEVCGVEPSEDAIRQAAPHIRPNIRNAVFNPDLFPHNSFDIVCCFQVLDHLLDPRAVLVGAQSLLREGGILLLINHNIRSWMPRVLGEGCPMYDIEHIYLFDRKTASQLLESSGYEVVRVANIPNRYTLAYSLKMLPLPGMVKRSLIALCQRMGLDSWCVRLPAGNMVSIGKKPGRMPPTLRLRSRVCVNNTIGCA